MNLGGLQKLTLIDYPGKIAATVFTVGCNFRCPFCHNPELVSADWSGARGSVSEEEFFEFLKTRKGKLDGVCITGGEPTVQSDIVDFMKKIKSAGFLVKLDSNGTRPNVLKKIIDERLADFIAMDIKNSLENYGKACGVEIDKETIKLSVELIRNSGIEHEFRTTTVPGIHTYEDFDSIAEWLSGAEYYALQQYRDGKVLDENLKNITAGKELDLNKIKERIEKNFSKVVIKNQ